MVDHDGSAGGEQHGITIGISLGYQVGTNVAVGPTTVVNDHRDTKRLRHFLCDHARSDVGCAACGVWNDHADGPAWVALGLCRPTQGDRCDSSEEESSVGFHAYLFF